MSVHYDDWTTEKDGTDVNGEHVTMLTATFGKGRTKVTYRRFFRNGSYVGYAATESDAEENWEHVKAGATWSNGEWLYPVSSNGTDTDWDTCPACGGHSYHIPSDRCVNLCENNPSV
jgi:hypothetical protein